MIKSHARHHRKMRAAWLADPGAMAQTSPEDAAVIQAGIDEIDRNFPDVKTLKADPVGIADLAQRYGVMDLYNTVYRATSGDAAHATVDALNQLVKSDAQANIIGLRFGPDASDLTSTLSSAISSLGRALSAVIDTFDLPQFTERLSELVASWKAFEDDKRHRT